MYTISKLPENYKAYDQLEICSNTINGGAILAVVGEVPPLLVGAGERPLIWMQAPTDFSGKKYLAVVDGSVSFHPAVKVVANGLKLTVTIADIEALSITQVSPEKAIIDHIDLSPIGFTIVGDQKGLRVGGATFATSTFNGVGALVSLAM